MRFHAEPLTNSDRRHAAAIVAVLALLCAGAELLFARSEAERPELAFGAPSQDYVERDGYVAAQARHGCAWTIEYLDAAKLKSRYDRSSFGFVPDPDQPTEFRWSNRAYEDSGFDRGHRACAEDLAGRVRSLRDSFLLTNAFPQMPELNRGPWRILEGRLRDEARRPGAEAWIVTGEAYLPGRDGVIRIRTLGPQWAPTHCWKALLLKIDGKITLRAWLFANDAAPSSVDEAETTVDEIEAAAGLDLFSGLDDELEPKLEAGR